MKDLKITKGEWEVTEPDGLDVESGFKHTHCVESEGIVVCDIICDEDNIDTAEHDAQLIADAGTTANKCGLFPSELLRQRDELLRALKEMQADLKILKSNLEFEQRHNHRFEQMPKHIQNWIDKNEKAINNTKGE